MDRPDAAPARAVAHTPMRGAATPLKTPLRTPLRSLDQTSTTPITPFEKIEAQKENVQPRARGRSAHALSTALGMPTKERQDMLAAQRREHEAHVHSDENAEADDPLDAWCAYVKWCIDNYPDGKSAESGIVPLLERATRTFRASEQYRNDSRYLRLWILYAQHTDVPRDVFQFLLANEMGTNLASLYEELANVLESDGAFDEADETYKLGIARRASPLDRLKRRYNEYQQRILSLPELADEPRTNYAQALTRAMAKAGRSVLGTKTGRGAESLPANVLGTHQPLSSAAPRPNARTMQVYCDENDEAPSGPHAAWSDLGHAHTRHKENQLGARTLQPLPQSAMTPRTQARALEVFCDSDEEASPRRTPRAGVLGQSAPSEADQLRRQPFLHYSPPALQPAPRSAPAPSQASVPPKAPSSKKRSAKPTTERHAAPLARLYPGLDIQTYVQDKARPLPRTAERCLDELYAERCMPHTRDADPWAYLDAHVGEWLPRREAPRRVPSPTVVTRAAMLEVDNMFMGDSEESDSEDSDSESDASVRYAVMPSEENAGVPPTPRAAHAETLSGGPSRLPFQPLTPITERTEVSRTWEREGSVTSTTDAPVPYGGLRAPPSTLQLPNPCSPADPDVVAALLANLAVPLSALPGYVHGHDELRGALPRLQARIGKDTTSRRASMGASAHELAVADMQLGVCAQLGEGGYGTVFLVQDLNESVPMVGEAAPSYANVDADDVDELERRQLLALKMESPPSGWEYYILEQVRHRVAPALQRSVVGARRFVWCDDVSLLLLEYASKGTLLELVNQAGPAGVSSALTGAGAGGVEEVLAMFYVIELCRVVEGLHTAGLLHGDLKIDNCMIRADDTDEWSTTYDPDGAHGWANKGVTLIDFGRAVDLWCYVPGQRFVADWAPGAQDCMEMREMRPWTYQADYYGLASIAHCLLFGKYMETTSYVSDDGRARYRLQQPLRRYWQTDLWTRFFELTLNPTLASAWPITNDLAALRADMEA
ncbi:non-specific serine/threonine protein kinase [Malassezia equina]|uniref:Non-specific serine/threonine protein kinase n=1 Tax=Malassezia equina TaxID=1381935 RepID=A0AAF0EIW3_9BASI|nr:non-specific serine/threonine protein kinase [Malassezia equina]